MRTAIRNQQKSGNATTLLVIVDRLYRRIPIDLIVRIESTGGNYSWIFTRNGEQYLTCQALSTIHQIIGSFWRVHRAHLVNPMFAKKSFGSIRLRGSLTLTTGVAVPVARRKRDMFCQRLRQLEQ